MDKHRFVSWFQKYLVNPVAKLVAGRVPGVALLETTGRSSGKPRRNPVSDGLRGDTFWIIAEHGRKAGYVRNIAANPRVRLRVRGRWRSGTAHILPDDDPVRRQKELRLRGLNHAMVRLVGTDLLTIRVDLDPA